MGAKRGEKANVVLAGFNLLDGAGNFCVGCAVYTDVVLPAFGPEQART